MLSAGCSGEIGEAGDGIQRAVEKGKTEAEKIAQSAGETGSSGQPGDSRTVTVTRVLDGDTVEIQPAIDGKSDLRLIGVDAPETDSSQPLSAKATRFTRSELEGERVQLTLGKEMVDPYGRLLGNVSVPGRQRLHAALLLERGLSQDLFYEPNVENKALFESIQQQARSWEAGIWGLSGPQQCALTDRGNGVGAGSPGC
jgi:endonuclease YncB( thermonuclease family)